MSDPIGSNDPMNPVYQQGAARIRPEEPKSAFGSKTNLAVLVIIAVAVLVILLFLGREKPAPMEPAPTATEIR